MKGCHMSHCPPLHCHQSSTATASPWHPVPRGDSPSHSPASAYAHSCAFGNTFFWQERDATKSVHLFQAGKISQTIAFLPPHYNHWKQRNNWSYFFSFFFILLLSLFNIILGNWQRRTETGRKILHTLPYRWKGKGSYMIQLSRIEGLRHLQFISFNPSDYMKVIRLQNVIHSVCLVLISVPKKRKAIFHSHSSDSIQVSWTTANEVIDSDFASTC